MLDVVFSRGFVWGSVYISSLDSPDLRAARSTKLPVTIAAGLDARADVVGRCCGFEVGKNDTTFQAEATVKFSAGITKKTTTFKALLNPNIEYHTFP